MFLAVDIEITESQEQLPSGSTFAPTSFWNFHSKLDQELPFQQFSRSFPSPMEIQLSFSSHVFRSQEKSKFLTSIILFDVMLKYTRSY